METNHTQVLDKSQTLRKVRRIAFQIYENNYQETEIILAGIYDRGYLLAKMLQKELLTIAPFRTSLVKVSLDKSAPLQSEIELDMDTAFIRGKSIVLVDDVLNSGRTLAYSLRPFLNTEIKKLLIAVLVDRGYKSFPVSADYVGYALSTTIKEHIEVILDDSDRLGVYLR